mmetsp:Transcript_36107/g.103283  ORF Transcript_36107/g.103283 Transcript_36107/m.103283 type:complete len:204 (+) Transcript_36107:442-1053(+)
MLPPRRSGSLRRFRRETRVRTGLSRRDLQGARSPRACGTGGGRSCRCLACKYPYKRPNIHPFCSNPCRAHCNTRRRCSPPQGRHKPGPGRRSTASCAPAGRPDGCPACRSPCSPPSARSSCGTSCLDRCSTGWPCSPPPRQSSCRRAPAWPGWRRSPAAWVPAARAGRSEAAAGGSARATAGGPERGMGRLQSGRRARRSRRQ